MLEPVIKIIEVPCSQERAFKIFVDNFSSWWPLQHSVSGMNGAVAKSVTLDAQLGGKIIEIRDTGEEELWGEVLEFDPSASFTMSFHMGLESTSATMVALEFEIIDSTNTKVCLTHSNWEAFGEKAEQMRGGFDGGWVTVFEESYGNACAAG